ncbi:MAG: hypothetical protein ACOY7L_17295 [Pseudomonadota bacterium]
MTVAIIDNRTTRPLIVGAGAQVAGALVAEATAMKAAAETAAAAAALSEATAESVVGPTYASISEGLGLTAEGGSFAVDNGDGTVSIYRKVSGVAVLQRNLLTTAAAAADTGAEKIGTATGDDLQTELNRGGRFKGPITGAPFVQTQARMREEVRLDEAPGADDTEKGLECLKYLRTERSGLFILPPREIVIAETWFVPSKVIVRGQGRETHVRFSGTIPTSITGTSHTNPLQGNFRTSAFALIGQFPDDITSTNYSPAHTGDYAVTEPRAFAANSVIPAGSTVLPLASASGLVAGDYLYLDRGYMGWHTALHEIVRIRSISGDNVTLFWPTQYEYRNASTDPFNLFMKPIAYNGGQSAPGVNQAAFDSWRQCGWRKVNPVINARLENMRISNEIVHAGYANLAVMICRGLDCSFDNIELTGGGLWNLQSEGTRGTLITDRSDTAFPQTDVLPGNGSNRTHIIVDMRTGSLGIEEGCLKGKFEGRSNTNIQVQQFCRETTVDMIGNSDNLYGILIDKSAPAHIKGRYTSPQPALWMATRDMFYYYPQATLAMWDSLAGDYFNGMLIEADCDYVESTANNGLDVYLGQPIRGRVNLGGASGGVYSIPASAAGVIVGSATRLRDRTDQTAPRVSARPAAIFPVDRDITYTDGTNDKVWRRVNLNRKTIAAVGGASTFTVNANTTQGGVKTGDIAMVLTQNTATVSLDTLRYVSGAPEFSPVSYTAGNARRWHISDVASIDTGTGDVGLTTAVPANWSAVAGGSDVSCVFFGRWG